VTAAELRGCPGAGVRYPAAGRDWERRGPSAHQTARPTGRYEMRRWDSCSTGARPGAQGDVGTDVEHEGGEGAWPRALVEGCVDRGPCEYRAGEEPRRGLGRQRVGEQEHRRVPDASDQREQERSPTPGDQGLEPWQRESAPARLLTRDDSDPTRRERCEAGRQVAPMAMEKVAAPLQPWSLLRRRASMVRAVRRGAPFCGLEGFPRGALRTVVRPRWSGSSPALPRR
jgi:hypothetical protein